MVPNYLSDYEREFHTVRDFRESPEFDYDDLITTTKGALTILRRIDEYNVLRKYRRIFRLVPEPIKNFAKSILFEPE